MSGNAINSGPMSTKYERRWILPLSLPARLGTGPEDTTQPLAYTILRLQLLLTFLGGEETRDMLAYIVTYVFCSSAVNGIITSVRYCMGTRFSISVFEGRLI